VVLAFLGLEHLGVALQVPLLRYLEDRVPGLATVAKDAGGGDDGEPLQQTVLDALTDAAEALQVLDVQRRHPDALGDTQPVGTCGVGTRIGAHELTWGRGGAAVGHCACYQAANERDTCCLPQVCH